MPSVLEFLRSEEPSLNDVPDQQLALFVRAEYPELLQEDPSLEPILKQADAEVGIQQDVQRPDLTPSPEQRTTYGGPPKNLNPGGFESASQYILQPVLQHTEQEFDESVVGISPEDVPSGQSIKKTLGVPTAIGTPSSAVAKVAAGVGEFFTSPKGMMELATSTVPGIGLIQRAKWVADMAKGAGEQAGSLSVTLEKVASNPGAATPEDYQKLADEAAGTAAMLYGAGKLSSVDVGTLTGVRQPLGRMVEGKKKRLSKDLAAQLMKKVNDPSFPALLQKSKQDLENEALARAWEKVEPEPGTTRRAINALGEFFSREGQLEQFVGLERLSKEAEKITGQKLAPSKDPYHIAATRRGTAGAIADYMVRERMTDLHGNATGPSLLEAFKDVKGRNKDLFMYLWAEQAKDLHKAGKNPGITLEDAMIIADKFGADAKIRDAAAKYRQWNRGILEYWRQADPSMSEAIDRMLKANPNYVPLARAIDPKKSKQWAADASSNPMMRRFGSDLPIRDIFEQTAKNSHRIISYAHKQEVLNAIADLSKVPGLEKLVKEVPRDRIREHVNFDRVRAELEEMGLDTSAVPESTMLTMWGMAEKPKGTAPIISIKGADGKPRWYEVDPKIANELEGLQVYRMGPIADLLLGVPSRTFRLGTTGLRPAFSLATNPTRDMQTWLMQTQTAGNPARMAADYFQAAKEIMQEKATGKASPAADVFYRSGAQLGQPLGQDINFTRKITQELFHGKTVRVVTDPVNHVRELLGIPEGVARVAEIKGLARDNKIDLTKPLTADQFMTLALAGKRATVDFSQSGRFAKQLNQAIPFYNPALQGIQSFTRAFAARPVRTVVTGLTALTIPTLANWYKNKDKEWYAALPAREKFLYTNIEVGDEILRIPRAFEWGNLFMVIPEAIFDSWYNQDPETAGAAVEHILTTTSPADLPVIGKIAKEQWKNQIEFFDRPIVPQAEEDLPPGTQRGPYTTKLAQWMGDIAPEHISPRRVDAAVRSYFGGAVPDLLNVIGLGSAKSNKDKEPADIPVFGTLFRRGGQFNSQNKHINDFFDQFTAMESRYNANSRGKKLADQSGEPFVPMFQFTDSELQWFKAARTLKRQIVEGQRFGAQLKSNEKRQRLYQLMGREAKASVDYLKEIRPAE